MSATLYFVLPSTIPNFLFRVAAFGVAFSLISHVTRALFVTTEAHSPVVVCGEENGGGIL